MAGAAGGNLIALEEVEEEQGGGVEVHLVRILSCSFFSAFPSSVHPPPK